MKTDLIQISWHTKEPVFSADFHTSGRVATGGGDNAVRIWRLRDEPPSVQVELLSSLLRHLAPVNCVRFSPDGQMLASGSDDGFVILWKLVDGPPDLSKELPEGESPNVEDWIPYKSIHANKKDVYDISWSSDSAFFITGSTDNTASIWSSEQKQSNPLITFQDHIHFVQGVAWDPLGKFVATQSSDRSARVYKKKSTSAKSYVLHQLLQTLDVDQPSNLAESSDAEPRTKKWKLFPSDNVGTFFRRLCWSPDGEFLFTPCALWCLDEANPDSVANTTLVWSRHNFSKPLLHLPCGDDPSLVVRCHPTLFQLVKDTGGNAHPAPWMDLPYRILFAVATRTEVILYDTQHTHALGKIAQYHLASHTDIAWSIDGKRLFITSRDAFCSLASFEDGELGVPFDDEVMHTG